MIYFSIALLLGWFSFYFDFLKNRTGRRFFYILSWAVLVLLAGLRYKVGGDTYNYIYEFNNFDSFFKTFLTPTNTFHERQPGWYFIVATSKLINSDFTTLQIILALIVNTTFFWFIKRRTPYHFTGVFIYYLFFYCYLNFEILRESLAVCVFMLSFESLLRRRYKIYYIYVALALLFHISAIFLIVLPLLFRIATTIFLKHNGKILLLKILLIASIIFIAGFLLNSYLQKLLPIFISNDLLQSKIVQYNDYDFTLFGILSSLFYYVAIPLFFIYKLKHQYRIQQLLSMMVIYVFIGASITFYSIFFRFLNYLIPLYILVISEYLLFLYKHNFNFKINLGKVFFAFIFIFIIFTNRYFAKVKDMPSVRWYSHWFPYHSIFDKVEDPNRKKLAEYQFH